MTFALNPMNLSIPLATAIGSGGCVLFVGAGIVDHVEAPDGSLGSRALSSDWSWQKRSRSRQMDHLTSRLSLRPSSYGKVALS